MVALLSIAIFVLYFFGVVRPSLLARDARMASLERRLHVLERRSASLDVPRAPRSDAAGKSSYASDPGRSAATKSRASTPTEPRQESASSHERPAVTQPLPEPSQLVPPVMRSPDPTFLEALIERVRRWFSTGNVPVKVGVLLSIVGVGFLVKEGIDRHWLVLPLGARLAVVAAFGVALLAVGWKLKARERGYGLSLQGGGVAVLYVTTYAAYAVYGLLGPTVAFALLFAVTMAAVLLALLQDASVLALLGIVGGFLAPLLTATDSGNHVALFGYYALLDIGIFAIAWFKAWRSLNVLGFLFTFAIGAVWGYGAYRPESFATVEPFLVLFVLLYIAIPVLYALRQPPELRGFVDGTLVFGTPILGFGLQAALVADMRYGLAISSLALALMYVGTSALVRRISAELRVLAEAQSVLGAAFIALALPLAFDARWTSAGWAIQGAALVWLGCRQRRRWPLLAGVGLQLAAGAAYAVWRVAEHGGVWSHGHWLGAALIALAGAWSSRLFDGAPEHRDERASQALANAAAAVFLCATAWWLWAGFDGIHGHAAAAYRPAIDVLFLALTIVVALLGARLLDWRRLAGLGLVAWPLALLLFLPTTAGHPGANLGWVAWPVLCASLFAFLRAREAQFAPLAGTLHTLAYWLATALLVSEVYWQVGRIAAADWAAASAFAVAAVIVLATLRARRSAVWPVATHARTYLGSGCAGVAAALLLGVLAANAGLAGEPAPLPYLPLANPLEATSTFALYAVFRWLEELDGCDPAVSLPLRQRAGFAAFAGLFLLTMVVARSVHHFAGVPFDAESLAGSNVLQASLSLVWGAAALAAMALGARRAERGVWLAGAALMAVVVVKLLLVDLGNTATLGRIVSFLGVGGLLLIVGYVAPVPPRSAAQRRSA